ncbi:hypothetical protein J6590_089361 [Homalodisca vitripennis]|nr:hypothetical protein J6590_089361 [Homalodisca vitripennis]
MSPWKEGKPALYQSPRLKQAENSTPLVSLTTHKYCPRILCLSCVNKTPSVRRRFIRQAINKTTSAVSQCLSQPTNTALVSYVFHVQIRLLVSGGDFLDKQ